MKSGWKIGTLFGIPLYIDSSWLFILVLMTFSYSLSWQGLYPEWSTTLAWVAGFTMAVLLFASVLLHELGHSLVARSQGIKVNSITLFLFGGIASIEQESKTPGQAFQVAIAGPAVSFSLALLLTLGHQFLPLPNSVGVIAESLAFINLVLALFNLIPGLPLDGGQVLKSVVWKITGSRFQGVHWAARSGKFLGWSAISLGIFGYLMTSRLLPWAWIGLLGWFGVRNANAYDRLTDLQEALTSLTAADAMTREFRVVDADMTLRSFADEYLLGENRPPVYFAASDGRYRGMVLIEDLRQTERSLWERETLNAIARPLDQIPSVQERSSLVTVINLLEEQQLARLTVLTPAGAVAGVIDRGDTVRALADRLNLAITDAEIKRIKEEGSYPPGFQLQAIARTANVETVTESAP